MAPSFSGRQVPVWSHKLFSPPALWGAKKCSEPFPDILSFAWAPKMAGPFLPVAELLHSLEHLLKTGCLGSLVSPISFFLSFFFFEGLEDFIVAIKHFFHVLFRHMK